MLKKWFLPLIPSVLWRYSHQVTCHNQDNPKEKHLWTQESSVVLFEVIWEWFLKQMSSYTFRCLCQVKLPQQVALTEFNSQVNARVRVMPMTSKISKQHSWKSSKDVELPFGKIPWAEPGKTEVRKTTPTSSTYCIQKSSQCLCSGSLADKFVWIPTHVKMVQNDWRRIRPMICLTKTSQPRQPQREALMKTRISSVSVWSDLNVTLMARLHKAVVFVMYNRPKK